MSAVVIFSVFLLAIALSLPIGISMILGATAPIALLHEGGTMGQLLNNAFSGANSTPILAVPLFILGGVIMAKGGISRKLFNFFAFFAGRIPGGLPCAVILTWSAGLVAVAGGLGVIIPPSIPFVLYSLATGVSTGKLFLAGILPGILVGLALMVYAVIYCLRKGEDKARVQERMDELSRMGFLQLFKESSWALLCPVIVLGGIYTGFTTPTEAAAVSVFYALLVSLFLYHTMTVHDILPLLRESVHTYGGLAFVLAFATAFGRVLSMTRATRVVESFILGNFTSGIAVLTVLVVFFLLLGMVMDTGPAIIILVPVLLPACKKLGIDPVHLGVVLVSCLSIGLATPPFGLDLFVAGNIAEKQPMSVAKKSVPFLCAFLVALVAITYIPWLSTWLPSLW